MSVDRSLTFDPLVPIEMVESSASDLGEATDEQLALQAQSGDLDAFDEIVRRYQDPIWRFLFKFCPHQSELEDLVQESFVKAYQKLSKWRPTGSFKSWLMRVAVNTGYDFYRRRKNEPISIAQRVAKETDGEVLEFLEERVEEGSSHPHADLIEMLLSKLKPEDRLVVTLHYYQGHSLPEIAEELGWGLSKTKVKSYRARRKLETVLRQHGLGGAN